MLPLLLRGKGSGYSYQLRDEFTTDASAPLASPRTCAPGPGALTLVQTDGQFSIVGGVLQIPSQTTPDLSSLGFYGTTYARQAGRFIYAKLSRSVAGATFYPFIGWGRPDEGLPSTVNNMRLSVSFGNSSYIFIYKQVLS